MILMSILAIAACGGGDKKSAAKPKVIEDTEPTGAPVAAVKPAPAPEPPPPKSWRAQADLTPVKGVRIKGATVTFAQEEGAATAIGSTGWFDGLKAGKYHLVVHEGTDCGANAIKAGKPMAGAEISFAVAKGASSLEIAPAASIQLDGDTAVVGHALVLHHDARGKPGKPIACGQISAQ